MVRGSRSVRARGCAVVISVVAAALGLVVAPAPAQPAATLPGIDVSHHQGTIDWGAVAADGTRFAFIKATEGRTFTDSRYAANRAAASAAGIKATAYHFARPDTTASDAVLEADHFVDVAQIEAGNLVPALDLEVNGGLNAASLIAWTRAFLDRVLARTGIRAAIYTSPYFWRTSMADTIEFGSSGNPLWIAHWGTNQPSVPATDWAGRGWTFWQWTNCDSVSGIGGCVDGDHFAGADLAPATVRALSAQTTGAGSVTSNDGRLDCGATCRVPFGPGADVTLTATPAGGSFLGWGGDCLGTGPTCTLRMDADRTVTASFSGTPAGALALSPASSSLRGGQAASITATLTDANGQPVQGAQVAFSVTGANEEGGTATTDTAGRAAFSYTGYRPGSDTVTAEANGSRGTATVSWQGCPGYSSDARNHVVGTPGDDELTPSLEAAVVCGLAGDDVLRGGTGNDALLGGDGDDLLVGGDGDDELRAGDGHDRLFGQDANDLLDGGPGNDSVSAGAGDDVVLGGAGDDRLHAGDGADRVYGGDGADYASAWTGDDLISGGDGDDAMAGGGGNDRMVGGAGADRMYAQDGADRLYARDGAPDRASGGPDADACSADRGDTVYGCESP